MCGRVTTLTLDYQSASSPARIVVKHPRSRKAYMTTALMLVVGGVLVLAGALAGRPQLRAIGLAPLGRSACGAIAATGLLCVVAGLILLGGEGASAKPGPVRATVEAELAPDEVSEEIRVFLDGRDMGIVRVDKQAPKARLGRLGRRRRPPRLSRAVNAPGDRAAAGEGRRRGAGGRRGAASSASSSAPRARSSCCALVGPTRRRPASPPSVGGVEAEPRLARADDRRRAIAHLQLGEDVRDVVAHRSSGSGRAAGDVRVGEPLRDEVEDLALARGELGEDGRRGWPRGARRTA